LPCVAKIKLWKKLRIMLVTIEEEGRIYIGGEPQEVCRIQKRICE